MKKALICPKCKGAMVKSYTYRSIGLHHRKIDLCVGTDVYDYVCVECGFVESYAEDPKVIDEIPK